MSREIVDFFNNEYRQQAQNDNITKIAKVTDGFKFTGAKFFHVISSTKDWTKVENLANKTADETEYPGGANNISGVIVNYVKDYVGTNNIPLAKKKGFFGSWMNNTNSAYRYISVKRDDVLLSKIFRKEDTPILIPQEFEGSIIEPKYFIPVIPMLLVNGSKAIGTGHAQHILSRNPLDIINHIKKKLKNDKVIFNNNPYYKNFKGVITNSEQENKFIIKGVINRINTTKTEILEIPFTYNYNSIIKKLDLLEDKGIFKRYDDLCNPKTDKFKFVIHHNREFSKQTDEKIIDILGLSTSLTENYTIVDENLSVKLYDDINFVFNHYYNIRLDYYQKRKNYIIKEMNQKIKVLDNKVRFIDNVSNGGIIVKDQNKASFNKQLLDLKFDKIDGTYNYLLNMNFLNLTKDVKMKLKKELESLKKELEVYSSTDIKDIWLKELKELEQVLDKEEFIDKVEKKPKEVIHKPNKKKVNIKELF